MKLQKDRVCWFWINGQQVQFSYCSYARKWYAMYNDSGVA